MNQQRRRARGFCVPGYRWCGPWCNGPGAPTNRVDACCMKHDECYRRSGNKKRCDELFINCLRVNANPYTKEGRDARLFAGVIRLRNLFRF